MSLTFSTASACLVRDLVALGVCDDVGCVNYSNAVSAVPQFTASSTTNGVSHAGGSIQDNSTEPALLLIDPSLGAASWEMTELAFARVGNRYSSSGRQMSQPLETFIDHLFSVVSCHYSVALETLVHALRLLEMVQMANIRRYHHRHDRHRNHQHQLLDPSSDQPQANRSGLPPVHPASFESRAVSSSTPAGGPNCLQAFVPASLLQQTTATRHVAVPRFGSDDCRSEGRSSIASSSVGPHTDDEASSLPAAGCGLSLADEDGRRPCSTGDSASAAAGLPEKACPSDPFRRPSPPLKRCAVCQSLDIFSLQHDNVQLLLTACLALSVSINEEAVMQATSEDLLIRSMAQMGGCLVRPLQMAMRVVCDALNGRLCVYDSEIALLLNRLGVVQPKRMDA